MISTISPSSERLITHMSELARDRLSILFEGASSIHLTDFPDYANVGDSAIALGLLKFFEESGRPVVGADSFQTIDMDAVLASSALEGGPTIAITGGGNLGNLYPHHQQHRERLIRQASVSTTIVQAPQSAHFTNERDKNHFAALLDGSQASIALGARDLATSRAMKDAVPVAESPDCAHVLGVIPSARPTSPIVMLLRRDDERRPDPDRVGPVGPTYDWPKDRITTQAGLSLRARASRVPALQKAVRPSVSRWTRLAQSRLRRGVSVIQRGEIVITDRLHGMIIAIQTGRRVVFLDNSTRKLSSYADLWFPDWSEAVVRQADGLDDAIRTASRW